MKNLPGIPGARQRRIFLAFVVSLSLTFSLHGQNLVEPAMDSKRPLEFEQFSVEQGLSQCTVNTITQDSFGFLWFGTDDGLNKFDGYSFKVYKHRPNDPNSLSHNSITAILEDTSGALWIGTSREGLSKFDRQQEVFVNYRNDLDNPASLSDDRISTIFQSRDGTLWIGTWGKGLNRLVADDSTQSFHFDHFKNDPRNPGSLNDNYVSQIREDSFGTLWIGTRHGLNMLTLSEREKSEPSFIHFRHDPTNPGSLSSNKITAIIEDRSSNLWIGTTGGGLNKLVRNGSNMAQPSFLHFQNDPSNPRSSSGDDVTAITEDLYGNLWIGTKDRGLNKLAYAETNASSPRFVHFEHDPNNPSSLRTDYVRSIFADHSGVLWIGTYNTGLNKLDPGKKQFIHYRKEQNKSNSLNHDMVWSILEDRKGVLWIGTHGAELTKFDREKNQFTRYPLPADISEAGCHRKVMAIYEDKSGILWLAAGEPGITKFNPETEEFSFQQLDSVSFRGWNCNVINVFYEDRTGTPWIGTSSGTIYEYLPTGEFQPFSPVFGENTHPKSNKILSMVEDRNGIMWLAAEGSGLYRFDREKGEFTNFRSSLSNPKSLSSDYASMVYEDESGTIWIGTYGGGLNKLIPGNGGNDARPTFAHYTEKEGLPNNVIYSILEDESGNLWLSTNYGLCRFNPQKETFANYNVNDGLQSNEFNSGAFYRSKSGEMFFGGINGFNSFFPQNIEDNSYVPKIVITDFSLFNNSVPIDRPFNGQKILEKSVLLTDEIELAYDQDVFSFEFAALHYSSPEKNQYAYKMEGFDKDWIHVSSNKRYAAYTNLDPGEYTFRVRGSNNDGVWNDAGRSVTLLITPPFWEVWWFRALVSVTLLALVITWYEWRTAKIRTRKQELEKQVKEKTVTTMALQNALNEVERLNSRLEAENVCLRDEIKLEHNFENIISRSKELKKVLHQVEQVASTGATVLILGESGTGKELLTRAIHNISDRCDRSLVKVNCSVLPSNLIESELFGHEKGAFTGATSRKIGRFELADCGTIFLDEIGDLPLELQAKLLRVLQEGEFERLGNPKNIRVDVRVIAATNRDLEFEVANGTFRQDLYYRLNVFPITIPPLRQRKEDIPLLVSYFVGKYEAEIGKKIETIPQSVMADLQAYDWPGNVRELENIIERAVILSNGNKLSLGDWLQKGNGSAPSNTLTLQENERKHIYNTLEMAGWKVSGRAGAASILGINPKTLESRMKRLNIKRIRNGNNS